MNTLLRIGLAVSVLSFFTGTYSQQFSISSQTTLLVDDAVPVIDSVSPKNLNNIPLNSNLKANCHKGLRHFGKGEVAVLVNEQLQPGTYEVDFDGSNHASGIYYYCLHTEKYKETKKISLVR